ncbi:MAG: hypothetical protein GXO77_04705 [Calditrichaeota bacterium]|nr:hypothetical protein [Calditrichota bacterium]
MKELKKKISVSQLLLEMFSVIFAILLALAVNEWRTVRANENLADEALKKIKKEISSNLEIVKKTLELNRNIKERQKKAFINIRKEILSSSSDNIDKQIRLKFPFAFMTEPVKKTAWNSANLTHAVEYLDFNIVEVLSSTYEGQERYSRFNEKILEKLSSPGLFKKETMISEFQSYFMRLEMYFQITESLIENYELCLKKIDAQK